MSVTCPNCKVRKMYVQNHMRSVPVYACESYGYPDKNCGYVISVVEYEIEHGLSTRKERINQRLRNRIYNGNASYAEADIEYLLSRLEIAEKALKKVEWIGANHELAGALECSCCGQAKEDGHSNDCMIDLALQQLRS